MERLFWLQKELEEEEARVMSCDLSLVHENVTEDEIAKIAPMDWHSGCKADGELKGIRRSSLR